MLYRESNRDRMKFETRIFLDLQKFTKQIKQVNFQQYSKFPLFVFFSSLLLDTTCLIYSDNSASMSSIAHDPFLPSLLDFNVFSQKQSKTAPLENCPFRQQFIFFGNFPFHEICAFLSERFIVRKKNLYSLRWSIDNPTVSSTQKSFNWKIPVPHVFFTNFPLHKICTLFQKIYILLRKKISVFYRHSLLACKARLFALN